MLIIPSPHAVPPSWWDGTVLCNFLVQLECMPVSGYAELTGESKPTMEELGSEK